MILKTLELRNFRNYEDQIIDFDDGTNIIYGQNAQGKTNILEAVYICATTKSHKQAKEKDFIRFGCDEAHIKAVIGKNDREEVIDLHFSKLKKKNVYHV